jgi:acylaminoacyl-peptidase
LLNVGNGAVTFTRSVNSIPPYNAKKQDGPGIQARSFAHTFAGNSLVATLPMTSSAFAKSSDSYVTVSASEPSVISHYVAGSLQSTIVLDDKMHGDVVIDGWFGGACLFGKADRYLMYTAYALKRDVTSNFTVQKEDASKKEEGEKKDKPSVGDTNVLDIGVLTDAGETYTGKPPRINLFVLDLTTGTVTAVTNTAGYSERQYGAACTCSRPSVGAADASGRAKFAYTVHSLEDNSQRPMGSVYCSNRSCAVYSDFVTVGEDGRVLFGGEPEKVSAGKALARGAYVTPSNDVLYLSSSGAFDVHNSSFALTLGGKQVTEEEVFPVDVCVCRNNAVVAAAEGGQEVVIVDYMEECHVVVGTVVLGGGEGVLGRPVALTDKLRDIEKANGVTGLITSRSVVAIENGVLYYKGSSPVFPGCVVAVGLGEVGLGEVGLDEAGKGGVTVYEFPYMSTSLVNTGPPAMLPAFDFTVEFFSAGFEGKSNKDANDCFLLLPNASRFEKPPVVVVPHGGPHGMTPSVYQASYAWLAGEGFAILHVNYRGSTGFGKAFCDGLAGNIGDWDVKDCVKALEFVGERFGVDAERAGVCGGSHGGFLAGHLVGQFPDRFKACAMRNPVTNLSSMVTTSDIFDWVYTESLGRNKERYGGPGREELGQMWDMSPIRYVRDVKTPTLMALGMSDRRVPPSQGVEYYWALRGAGVECKMLVYAEDVHAIGKPESEADHWVNIAGWMRKWL